MALGDDFTGALHSRRKSSKKFLLVTTHKTSFLLVHGNNITGVLKFQFIGITLLVC